MRHSGRSLLAVLYSALHLMSSTPAQAQTDVPRGHVGAGFALAIQPEGPTDGHYLNDSTLRGVSAGIHLLAGVRVISRVSADIEVTITAPISGEQVRYVGAGYTHDTVEHRETIVSAIGRWSAGSQRWRLEPVGGVSWVLTDTQSKGQLVPFNPSDPAEAHELSEGGTHTALTTGVDVPCLVSDRVAVVPFFRVHWVKRPGIPEGDVRGLSSVVYRTGLLVSARW